MKILHLEIRDFYLTVERAQRKLPEDTDMVIHFPEDPGFVVTFSRGAAEKGVRPRIPLEKAKSLLPGGIFVPADYQNYARVSDQLGTLIRDRYPFTEQLDFYEWFCDLSDEEGDDKFREVLTRGICRQVPFKIDFSLSRNKFLAKLGNDTGQNFNVASARDMLNGTSLGHFWGIPKKWIHELQKLGLESIGEVGGMDPNVLDRKFVNAGRRLVRLGQGDDDYEVQPFSKPTRLSRNGPLRMSDGVETHKKLLARLSRELSEQLRKGGHVGFAMSLEVTGGGQRVTHRYRFLLPTTRSSSLLVGAASMLKKARDLLPQEGLLDLNLSVSEIACDREQYQLHGSPRTDFELMKD